MSNPKLFFENAAGERLSARLDRPADDRPIAYALFAHCFTCTKNLKAVRNISHALTNEGIAVLQFDFTGLGESEGDFSETNFSSNVADLVTAADFLGAEYQAPRILIGHSLGGAAVLQAAASIPSCTAVATVGAPAEPAHVTRMLDGSRAQIEAEGEAQVMLAGRSFTIKKQFLDDLEQTQMQQSIRNLGRALLVCHSPVDKTVGIDNAAQIYQTARHPKSFVSLDRADHLLMNPRDSRYVGSIVAAWATRYLDRPEPETTPAPVSDNRVVVRTGKTPYQTDIIAHGHHLTADEPVSAGGADTGATPYDYLTAALGACTSITLRMYADRKGWPVDEIIVRLQHRKVHAEDCAACETEHGYVDRIDRTLEFAGDLTDEQRARLLEIADRCPVHRTLHSEVVVQTRLKK